MSARRPSLVSTIIRDVERAIPQLERAADTPCARGCCWSPYGHSAAATNCKCHTLPKGTR